MFEAIGKFAVHRRKLALYISLGFVIVAGVLGADVSSRLSAGGYDIPNSESSRAAAILAADFDAGVPNLVLLLRTPDGADAADAVNAGNTLVSELKSQVGVGQIASYWTSGQPPALKSRTGDSALVLAQIEGDEDEVNAHLAEIRKGFQGNRYQGFEVRLGGAAEAYWELNEQTQSDLIKAELIAVPIILLLLLFVFRGVIAALLPLVIGLFSIVGTLWILALLSRATDVSVFAMNLTTGLGLGLGIDYSLFILYRFREELANGRSVSEAVLISTRTAGRTVFFSALTVAVCLSALLIFPMYFLRSFAYAGIAVVIFAAIAAIVVLPAILAILGERVNKWSVRKRPAPAPKDSRWYSSTQRVMRSPFIASAAMLVLFAILAFPFLGIKFALADEESLPQTAQAHVVHDVIAADYTAREMDPVTIVVPDRAVSSDAMADFALRVSSITGISRVDAATGTYVDGALVAPATVLSERFANGAGHWLSAVLNDEPSSDEGQGVVTKLRSLETDFPIMVGGAAAELQDTLHALSDSLPYSLAIIGVSMLVLLFLLTGSVLLPIKAIVMNVLSLSATFGALVWVFQEGHLRWLVGDFTVTGTISAPIPIMLFCIAFGLSMDYEVFLLSRIREEHLASGKNSAAVSTGIAKTGPLITAAALLVAVVFISFITSSITYMKVLGLGLALAVLLDATLIRAVLVPAFMAIAGRFNWWAPAPLRKLHDVIGLSESDDAASRSAQPSAK